MKARPVHEEPVIVMQAWAIVLSPSGTAHVGGMHEGTRLRLSTAVESFDLSSMTARTRSGRTYFLDGVRNDNLGLAAVAVFRGPLEAEGSRLASPEELELMLAPPANGWRA